MPMIGIKDLVSQSLFLSHSSGGEIRPNQSAAAVYLVASRASPLTIKDLLSGGCTATYPRICDVRLHGQAANVGHHLPRLLRTQFGKGRHLRAADAVSDVQEDLAVFSAVRELPLTERGRPLSTSMAGLASLCVKLCARIYRGAVAGKRILVGWWSLLGEKNRSA